MMKRLLIVSLILILSVITGSASDTRVSDSRYKLDEVLGGVSSGKLSGFLGEYLIDTEIPEYERERLLRILSEKADRYGSDRAASEVINEMSGYLRLDFIEGYLRPLLSQSMEDFRQTGFLKRLRYLVVLLDPFRFGELRIGRILKSEYGYIISGPDEFEKLLSLTGAPAREERLSRYSGQRSLIYGFRIGGGFVPTRIISAE